MGATIEAKKAEQLNSAAQLRVDNAAARRMQTEDMLRQEELFLGTPQQVSGQLGGGLNPAELPFASRYQFNDQAAGSITGAQFKVDALKSGVDKANALMEQAQAAARAGDAAGAQRLKDQADAAVMGDFNSATGARNSIFKNPQVFGQLITQTTDPTLEAMTRLNSPLAQTVGANVARGRELADPNSAARAQLTNNIVNQPVNTITQGQNVALGNISQRTSAALRAVDQGFGQAISEITMGEAKSLSAIDAGFGRALQAITVGEAKSITEIDNGLQYALTAVAKATENALRGIEAGAQGTRRAMTDQMRQRGAAARPFEAQAVQARTEERFSTERAVVETEKGRQDATLQAGASGERAGIYERANTNRAGLESQEAVQKSNTILSSASQRGQLQANKATTTAQLQQQAGMSEAQINLQATLAKADVMQRGQMFVEQFSADFSFNSVNQAQAFLSNQAGVREQFQGAMDNLAVTAAGFQDAQAQRTQAFAMQLQAQDFAAEQQRKQTLTQLGVIAAGALTGGIAGFALAGSGAGLAGAVGGVAKGASTAGSILNGGGRQTQPSNQPTIIFGGGFPQNGTPPINPNSPNRTTPAGRPTIVNA